MGRSSHTLESLVATRINLLIDALGTATRVAECLGVTRPMLSKWHTGTVMPTPAQAKLLVDLDHVVARGSLVYPPEIVHEWLFGHDSYLEGARPIDVLHLRGNADVLAALDSLEQSAWGG
jgi:transcriptional regulator with XRE-family HTH domain